MKVEFKLDTSIEEDRQELEKILNGVDHKIDHTLENARESRYVWEDIQSMLCNIKDKEILCPEMWEEIYKEMKKIKMRYDL